MSNTRTTTTWVTLAALVATSVSLLALRKVKVRKAKSKKDSLWFI
jgi:hypothetical protein